METAWSKFWQLDFGRDHWQNIGRGQCGSLSDWKFSMVFIMLHMGRTLVKLFIDATIIARRSLSFSQSESKAYAKSELGLCN